MAAIGNLTWGQILRPTWRMISFDKRELWILFTYTLALGVVASAVPFASQILVNQAAFTGAAPPIIALALIVFGVLMIGTIIRLFQIRVAGLMSKRVFVRTALESTTSLLSGPPAQFDADDREIANRFFDVANFQVRFAILVSEGLTILTLVVIGIAILSFYHPLLLGFSVLVLLASVLIIVPFAKRGVERAFERSDEKYKVAFWLSQVAEHRSLLQQSQGRNQLYKWTDQYASQYVRAYFNYLRVILYQGGAIFVLQAVASAAFFGLGGWLVVQGQLNLGQLVAAEIVLLSIMTTLGRFNFYLDSFYEMVVSAKKVSDLTQANAFVDAPRAAVPEKINGLTIESDLLVEPLQLKAGDMVALRSPSRSGLSQFLHDVATYNRSTLVSVTWDADNFVDRSIGGNLFFFVSEPAVLRLTLTENLALVSDDPSAMAASSRVLDTPLLNSQERSKADQDLSEYQLNISDRSRYANARAFVSSRPVVLIDMFFNMMDVVDQIVFVREFKQRFPDRILLIHSFDAAIDPYITRVVKLKETMA
jgi:ABC-type multidrug transport system fused ATPase/permease subunit